MIPRTRARAGTSAEERVRQEIVALERAAADIQTHIRDLRALVTDLYTPRAAELMPVRVENSRVRGVKDEPAPQLRLFCFGAFAAQLGARVIPFRTGGKGQHILKFLVLQGGRVPRDLLLDAVWPDTDTMTANNRLKVAIHHLRQAFSESEAGDAGEFTRENGVVAFSQGAYFINPDLNIWTDVEQFETNLRLAKRMERMGRGQEAVKFYENAEQLYRGDLFEQDHFEEWMLPRREGLKDSYLMILDKLSRHWHGRGDIDRAVDGWKKILEKDACREDAYRAVMQAYAQKGQRSAALRWFEVCVQTLRAQLDIEPEAETVQLAERLKSRSG